MCARSASAWVGAIRNLQKQIGPANRRHVAGGIEFARVTSTDLHPSAYFSERMGKTNNFPPDWNWGPILFKATPPGNRSSSPTPRTRARNSISQSGTLLRCNSRLAMESRLMLQPRNWSLVASNCCDQPFRFRHFLTSGPTRFKGVCSARLAVLFTLFFARFTGGDDSARQPRLCVQLNTQMSLARIAGAGVKTPDASNL